MGFCDLHKQECEHIVNVIEVKRGKITELNICSNCLSSLNMDISDLRVNEIKSLTFKKECPKCGINEKELSSNKLICSKCCEYFKINDKLSLFETKMAAAIAIEDYEAAAIFKKEIEKIKNS